MVLPFAWVNTEADRIASVKPYTALQQEGRDIYIREGCNNCHTQTVRPLVAEVLRYGDYSKSGEFVYDRPFLWGSKRTGPDLARIGGKYPDEWHYKHMKNPQAMVPRSNMPAYGWLAENKLDPESVRHKMDVLGFPYSEEDIKALGDKNELDAIIAYLQKLGSDIPWREKQQTTIVGKLHNPYANPSPADIREWNSIYQANCAACHGKQMEGDIGPGLKDVDMEDNELFKTIYNGLPDDGMPRFSTLGTDKTWKLVNLLKHGNHNKE